MNCLEILFYLGLILCKQEEPNLTFYTPYDSPGSITASGQHVRSGIVAANRFPFGTQLYLYGELYEVQDRHASWWNGIDVWFPDQLSGRAWIQQHASEPKEIYVVLEECGEYPERQEDGSIWIVWYGLRTDTVYRVESLYGSLE